MKKLGSFKLIKYSAFLLLAVLFYSCESNDTTTNSVYIPKPINKKVLVEFFTNSGCVPCIAAHGYIDQIKENVGATNNDTGVVILSYHTRYPYIFDSLYRANLPQNQGRADYYSINTTPNGRLNGLSMDQFSASTWGAQINAEFNTMKYLNITASVDFDTALDSGTVTANISLVNALPSSNTVIHMVITEDNISYVTAPNGITSPDDVMRYMITGKDGESISVGQNIVTKSFGTAPLWNANNCHIVIFIQDAVTKQVFGVERVKVIQ
jgi:thiol-disulfide isomerase/thioredoxin